MMAPMAAADPHHHPDAQGGAVWRTYQTVDVVLVARLITAVLSIVSRNVHAIDSAVISLAAQCRQRRSGAFSVAAGIGHSEWADACFRP